MDNIILTYGELSTLPGAGMALSIPYFAKRFNRTPLKTSLYFTGGMVFSGVLVFAGTYEYFLNDCKKKGIQPNVGVLMPALGISGLFFGNIFSFWLVMKGKQQLLRFIKDVNKR